jgi:hypothetical protein
MDLDLVIRLQPDSIRAAFNSLASIGYVPIVPVTAEAFAEPAQRAMWITEKGMTDLNFHSKQHRETPVDVFVSKPIDFEAEHGEAVVEEIAPGVTLRFVRLEMLLQLKQRAGRQQDLADFAELRRLHGDPGHA